MNPEQVKERVDKLLQQSPFASLSSDMRLLMQSQLSALISKANLVSREEFDVQADALRRTQEQLAELEQKIQLLEQAVSLINEVLGAQHSRLFLFHRGGLNSLTKTSLIMLVTTSILVHLHSLTPVTSLRLLRLQPLQQ